jgi:tetratricopeptide (TPR) repeat protein
MKKTIIILLLLIIAATGFCAEKYAVLIAPDRPLAVRELEAVWNDMVLMYKTLISKGFTNDHIYVLHANGEDFPGYDDYYNYPIVNDQYTDFPGTLGSIQNVLSSLSTGNTELGIPELQSDDFLFIWIFGHGGNTDNIATLEVYYDNPDPSNTPFLANDFGAYINAINCQKIVLWMSQCNSGGFSDFITHNNTVVLSACQLGEFSHDADDKPYENGPVMPGLEKEFRGIRQFLHTEFDFHVSSVVNGENSLNINTYNGIPYALADNAPTDGIFNMHEAFTWANSRDSWSDSHPNYRDDNNVGNLTSLEYPNIISCLEDVPANNIISGIVAITQDICISNAEVTIAPGAKIYLKNRSQILIEGGASLIVSDKVKIFGNDYSIPPDETNPNGVVGNRIVVHGSISIGDNVIFTSENGNPWDGLYYYGINPLNLDGCTFHNCNLKVENGNLNILNSIVTNATISSKNNSVNITDCPLINGIYCLDCNEVNITNNTQNSCYITGPESGISLVNCGEIYISGYNITGNSDNGINLSECYASNVINYCTITCNGDDGIRLYHSNTRIISCLINGNNKGILAYRGSTIELFKDPNTPPWVHDSSISNNTWQEILFLNDCDLQMDNGMNRITDGPNVPGTFDQYLIVCPNMSYTRSMRYNFWGADANDLPVLPPESRFYPSCINPTGNEIGYMLDPLWNPGPPPIITRENDELMYHQAVDLAIAGNIESAVNLFKQLISQCPDSDYAPAAAKNLLALAEDKQALKDYYHTEPNLHWNGDIAKLADYLENYCNIKMGNYQEAIAWFEAVIADPPSELDSLMAVIDLGYVYLLMQENPPKSAITCLYPQLKPKSRKEYEQNTDALLSALHSPADHQIPNENDSGAALVTSIPVLHNNYPNPFNPITKISYSLPDEMDANLVVFNIKGQVVRTLVSDKQSSGLHTVTWNGTDNKGNPVASGIYFYRLATAGIVQTARMVMLK